MKKLIKLILLLAVVCFALVNYRIFSFSKGISKTDFEGKSFGEAVNTIAGIEKIEYYKRTISSGDEKYKVYMVTNGDAYLFSATEDDITALTALGLLSSNLKPEKISPIPFYVEIIVGLVIIFFPTGKKHKKNS